MNEQPMHAVPFDQSELSNITAMATLMIVAGAITIVSGVLGILGSIVNLALTPSSLGPEAIGNVCGAVIAMGIYGALGAWLIVGGRAFKRVVTTDEADQAHLATGLRQLRNVFLLKSILIILAICLVCVIMVVGIVAGTSMSDTSY
jgi:hypothetical protein